MDRELLEARLREIAASADATKTAAETLLRELAQEGPPGVESAAANHAISLPPTPHPAGPTDAPAADEVGARLVAMKLALDGVPRDEAAKRISADFEIANPESLIADVYERAGA